MTRSRSLLLGTALALAALGARAETTLHFVQGVPASTFDVYVGDAQPVVRDAAFTSISSFAAPPADTLAVRVFPAGADPATTAPVLSLDALALEDGASVSLVAHLGAAGELLLTPFVDDLSPPPPTESRIVVRHVAQAPLLDVVLNGRLLATLSSPGSAQRDVAGKFQTLTLAASEGRQPSLGPVYLKPEPGTVLVVYAVGAVDRPAPAGEADPSPEPNPLTGRGSRLGDRWRRSAGIATSDPAASFTLLRQKLDAER
ncbi:MAG TPA: DUF4397 domain-containing protein [Candidatus Polarisedimenticolaceae bacterium]|nr:DUF4397 domain-containing protein [Candidatus Polarisedimenticolaceae bacterium]